MSAPAALAFRDLTASSGDLEMLRRFHDEVYAPEFPDPDEKESLENIARYLELKASGWYGANGYHVLVAEVEGQVIGGAIADYLAEPDAGVVEFLVVAPARRGTGLGRRVLERTEALLAEDAQRSGRPAPSFVVAEINDPFRVDLDADNLDPFLRCRIWGRWGYRKLDFPYVQPALSEGQRPVHHLLLAVKPGGDAYRESIAAARVRETVHAYLRWAMRIPEPEANAEYRSMRAYLATVERVGSIPLDRYVGHDPDAPIVVTDVVADGPDLDAVIALYGASFPPGTTALDVRGFRAALAACRRLPQEARHYLWAIRAAPEQPVAGMASFFALPGIGFGGYVAFGAPLRGRGRVRSLVARIEEQMRRARMGARGWLIECEPGTAAVRVFERLGFAEIPIDYRQPPLPGGPDGQAPRLSLAYKPFGAVYGNEGLTAEELRSALASVNRFVYGLGSLPSSA